MPNNEDYPLRVDGLFNKAGPVLVNLGRNDNEKKTIKQVLHGLKLAAGLGAAVVAVDAVWSGVDGLRGNDCSCCDNICVSCPC
jgi:hypothetical protein